MENSESRHVWDIETDEQEYLDLLAMFGEGYVDLSGFEFRNILAEDNEDTVDNVS